MTDKATQAVELLHKLTSSGMFPALNLAMKRYATSQLDTDWMQVIKHSPKELRALIVEGMEITLPAPDGYDAKDKPRWKSSTLAKHLGIDHSEVRQFIKERGLEGECAANQIIGLVN